MEALPILSAANRAQHAEWHAYFERVYREPVASPVDLNTFTWFYHWAPRHPDRAVVDVRPGDVPADAPWMLVQHTLCNTANPERALSRQGFFVNRRLADVSLTAGSRVEILRVSDFEVHQRWFYAVRGSGIFIDLPCAVARLAKPGVPDNRLMDGVEGGAIFEWLDSRLELVLRGHGGAGISNPCVDGFRYSTGWSRSVALRCHNPPGGSMKPCVLLVALSVGLMASGRPLLALVALAAAVALCRTRPREATFTLAGRCRAET